MSDINEYLDLSSLNSLNLYGPWVWYLVGFYLCLPFIVYIILPNLMSKGSRGSKRRVSIYVLGDLGHSPRMCYHARSFAGLDYSVDLCGYLESDLPLDLIDHPSIDLYPIPVITNSMNLPFILFAVQKITLQLYYLFKLLFELKGTNYIMIQNPPSIPILLVVIIFTKLFSDAEIIIDWHNLNYSILNLRYQNENHIFVRVLKLYEKYLGRFAAFNLTVTKNMKKFLVEEFGIQPKSIRVLYDRPGPQFYTLDQLEFSDEEIKLHEIFENVPDLESRKILVSSTSFTPDEDFNILLEALKLYDDSEQNTPLLLLVTGKGPLKEEFLKSVVDHKFLEKVFIKSVWLAAEDYPLILSVADIGISLHTSSSGLDLPMKILDFFGCGIPVISLNFSSINELVKHGVNGLITDAKTVDEEPKEICRLLNLALFDDKVKDTIKLGAMKESTVRWKSNWLATMGDTFKYN